MCRVHCMVSETTHLLPVVGGLAVCVSLFCGGYSGGETPGSIPNPEAKASSADGTALGRVWESRTPPLFCWVVARNWSASAGWFRATPIFPAPFGYGGGGVRARSRAPGSAGLWRFAEELHNVVRVRRHLREQDICRSSGSCEEVAGRRLGFVEQPGLPRAARPLRLVI